MRLGDLIRTKREGLGLSLQDVANSVGISKSHIWELERSSSMNPSLMLSIRLSLCLGIPINALAAALLSEENETLMDGCADPEAGTYKFMELEKNDAEQAIWQAIQNITIGNKTDDKLIFEELRKQALFICRKEMQ